MITEYIGGTGGYLGDLTYGSHRKFYPLYCGLDINPDLIDGTTRKRFIKILRSETSMNQAKILRGTLEKYPFASFSDADKAVKGKYHEHILKLIEKLEETTAIAEPELAITSDVVQKAINDARTLIQNNGAISAVDRTHTALHGYLKAICKKENIVVSKENPTTTDLFKEIKKNPKFQIAGNRKQDIEKIINSMANILDSLNPIRNTASVAHPNEHLLGEAEAYLVINSAQTLLHYLNSKFKE